MIKYIGSKRLIVPHIRGIARAIPDVRAVCDLFAGTTRVGQALKAQGLHVLSNDLASYSEVLGRSYIQADARTVDTHRLTRLLDALQRLPPRRGYVTRTFCEEARYFQPHNGERIDAMREGIDALARDDEEHAILLTSLILAADRVDSTTGLQMAYLKRWASRSEKALELQLPRLLPTSGRVTRRDANDLARDLDDVDLVYIDPPYNQHSYYANYHLWETLVRNDHPEAYGKARKRVDCRDTKSAYNRKHGMPAAFTDLIHAVRAPYLLVSFNTEGFLSIAQIQEILRERGYVAAASIDFKRYVGAQIGIYNPRGEKVGRVSHLRNHEWLFLVGPSRSVVDAAMRPLQRMGEPHVPPSSPAATTCG